MLLQLDACRVKTFAEEVKELVAEAKSELHPNALLPSKIWLPGCEHMWVKNLADTNKGVFGEKIASKFMQRFLGFTIGERTSPQNDFIATKIGSYKFENKLSCLNEDGTFKWRSIRLKDDYSMLGFVGVYPNSIRVWIMKKSMLLNLIQKRASGVYIPEIGYSNGGKNHMSHAYVAIRPDPFLPNGRKKKASQLPWTEWLTEIKENKR